MPSLAESYGACLRLLSDNIETVGDGQAAVAAIGRTTPDVVVLDVNLPGIGGIDILKRLRDSGAAGNVIVITGKGSIRLAVDAMRYRASGFLVKPFGMERLRSAVSQALEAQQPASAGMHAAQAPSTA